MFRHQRTCSMQKNLTECEYFLKNSIFDFFCKTPLYVGLTSPKHDCAICRQNQGENMLAEPLGDLRRHNDVRRTQSVLEGERHGVIFWCESGVILVS